MNFTEPKIEEYAVKMSTPPSVICAALEQQTRQVESLSEMLIGKLEASFLATLIHSLQAKRILELGTFTGYSALAMAEHLPENGEIHTIDINKKNYTDFFWKQSRHVNKIHFHQGEALNVIKNLDGPFDLIFIDADKENYANYFNELESKLAPHGLIVVDNVLWSGRVLLPDEDLSKANDTSSLAIKRFNELLLQRQDLHKTLLPIRDGILLISRKANS